MTTACRVGQAGASTGWPGGARGRAVTWGFPGGGRCRPHFVSLTRRRPRPDGRGLRPCVSEGGLEPPRPIKGTSTSS
ncbi:hypothetical protein SBD_7081 [Streptomyces bottropensis ATCC 25435]|uniref:Uncharacterized protein n=1 Tax=Streptomyces bottropensis ATCC 25435 TaxID=1054862 RepID=M3E5P9_9ACTN|nr:hypothetical protein SBD_7081 [Streptomyces bottropensis ATCC 25435]